MRIYLDNCSFNRPYDKQVITIKIETEAKLYVQELITKGQLDLVWSYALDYENDRNPFKEKRSRIGMWKQYAVENIKETETVLALGEYFVNEIGLKIWDALHLACAVEGKCEYFLTTDRRVVNKCTNETKIRIINPIQFLEAIT
jgi:predicted nucleic acid-binding protein